MSDNLLEDLVRKNLQEGPGLYFIGLNRDYTYDMLQGIVVPTSGQVIRTTIIGFFRGEKDEEIFCVEPYIYLRIQEGKPPRHIEETRAIKVRIPFSAALLAYKKSDMQERPAQLITLAAPPKILSLAAHLDN